MSHDLALSRRALLKYLGVTTLAASSPQLLAANTTGIISPERRLRLRNLHTGEHIDEVFWAQGEYNIDGIQAINKLLRDHRSNQTTSMDRQLFNVLIQLQARLQR